MVFRVYVEKKPGFDVEAQQLAGELRTILGLTGLKALRIVNRYDVEGISQELFDQTAYTVLAVAHHGKAHHLGAGALRYKAG